MIHASERWSDGLPVVRGKISSHTENTSVFLLVRVLNKSHVPKCRQCEFPAAYSLAYSDFIRRLHLHMRGSGTTLMHPIGFWVNSRKG